MKKKVAFIIIVLVLTGLVIYTSLNDEATYEGASGYIGPWINRYFFSSRLSKEEVLAVVGFGAKAVGHVLLFALTGLFSYLLLNEFFDDKKKAFWILLAYGLVLASLGETIQIFSAGRHPTFRDVVINYSSYLFPALVRRLYCAFNPRS